MATDTIIKLEDIEKVRSIENMDLWLNSQYEKFSHSQRTKEYFRARKGLVKELMEEVLPIFCYAKSKYGLCEKTTIQPVIGNQSFDAFIDNRVNKYKVEATVAIDGYQEHHRMNILNKDGGVPAWSEIEITGIEHTGHSYKFDRIAVSSMEIYEALIARITIAYNKKISKSYSDVQTLIIGFEDFIGFNEGVGKSTFKEMLYKIENIDAGYFKEVWVVGTSGKFHAKINEN